MIDFEFLLPAACAPSAAELPAALAQARAQTLQRWQAFEAALGPQGLDLRYGADLMPPRWWLGHLAWFEERWLARNPLRLQGAAARPLPTGGPAAAADAAASAAGRAASVLPRADELFDPALIRHTQRWHAALPSVAAGLRYLRQVRERSLALLPGLPDSDDGLHFARLVLGHELHQAEALAALAQTLGVDIGLPAPAARLGQPADGASTEPAPDEQQVLLDLPGPDGEPHQLAFDAQPVSWRRYLAFVEAGGYEDESLWTPAGWTWRRQQAPRPRVLARDEETGAWKRAWFGRWLPLNPQQPAQHLSLHEAQAWCRWAGRRLPTEAEWAAFAAQAPAGAVGQVREWTAPVAPGADGRAEPQAGPTEALLAGPSWATPAPLQLQSLRLRCPAERNDLFSGLRSCAAAAAA